jgi:hypothetical protein
MKYFIRESSWAKARSVTTFGWAKEAAVALLVGGIYLLANWELSQRIDRTDVSIGLVAAIGAAILCPIACLGWNFFIRAPRLIAEDEAIHYRNECERIEVENATATAALKDRIDKLDVEVELARDLRNEARLNEWKELRNSFHDFDDLDLRVDIDLRSDGDEQWSLRGSHDSQRKFGILAAHGGNLLQTSPEFVARQPRINADPDPVRRWLKALYYDMQLVDLMEPDYGVETDPYSGKEVRSRYSYRIGNPARHSETLCTKIRSEEALRGL